MTRRTNGINRPSDLARIFIATTRVRMLLVLLFAVGITRASVAQDESANDVWRLAGTFNGTYFIELTLPAGRHEFKFVRGGDWGAGHFGAAPGASNELVQPGNNITLDLQSRQPVSIIFDPDAKKWRRATPEVDEPVAVAKLRSAARVQLPVTIDFADSLVPGHATIEEIEVEPIDPDGVTIREIESDEDGVPSAVTVVPHAPGQASLRVRIRAGGVWSRPVTFTFDVLDRVYAIFPNRADEGVFDLEPIDGTMEWALTFEADTDRPLSVKVRDIGQRTYLAKVVRPNHEGEHFALVYSRRTNTLTAIPGAFELVEENGQHRLVDRTPLPDDGLFHDPRRPDHFIPVSADLHLFDLVVETAGRANESVSVIIHGEETKRMPLARMRTKTNANSNGRRVWKGRFQLTDADLESGKYVRYSIHRSFGEMIDAANVIGPFERQIEPTFETPDWAKKAVWYQIFPERFRNGNETNDPHGQGVFFLPWNAEWHTVHPGEFEAWQKRVRAYGENPDQWDREITGEPGGRFYNVVWDRRYGGDLQGVIEKLDMLEDLGITALYLNPVFEGVSMHKYDTSDFRHVDDNFGNQTTRPPASWSPDPDETYDDPTTWEWTEADRTFLRLIEEVHARDMKIIIDGVFNHVGRAHPAFQDVMENGIESEYAEWFTANFDEDGNLESWVAWDGPSGWLPKLRQQENRALVWPVEQHIFDITERWMDPNRDGDPSDGVDGWRLDVPLDVGDPFWRDWCAHVRRLNPEAYITGEIWSDWESVSRLQGDMFDAQMHYPFANAVIDWLVMKPGMTATQLASRLNEVFRNDAPQTRLVQQNLYASHDTERLVSNLFNHDPPRAYDAGDRPQQGEPFDESKPDERAYALSKLALVCQATYVGAPMIYYGAEVGMYGADDPSCRKPYPWPDVGPMQNPDANADMELKQFYQSWLNQRADNEVLQLGTVRHVRTNSPDVFAFERRLNDRVVLVVINKGDEPFDFSALLPSGASWEPGRSSNEVEPWSARMVQWRDEGS